MVSLSSFTAGPSIQLSERKKGRSRHASPEIIQMELENENALSNSKRKKSEPKWSTRNRGSVTVQSSLNFSIKINIERACSTPSLPVDLKTAVLDQTNEVEEIKSD